MATNDQNGVTPSSSVPVTIMMTAICSSISSSFSLPSSGYSESSFASSDRNGDERPERRNPILLGAGDHHDDGDMLIDFLELFLAEFRVFGEQFREFRSEWRRTTRTA